MFGQLLYFFSGTSRERWLSSLHVLLHSESLYDMWELLFSYLLTSVHPGGSPNVRLNENRHAVWTKRGEAYNGQNIVVQCTVDSLFGRGCLDAGKRVTPRTAN